MVRRVATAVMGGDPVRNAVMSLFCYALAQGLTWYLLQYRRGAPEWASFGFGIVLGAFWDVMLHERDERR